MARQFTPEQYVEWEHLRAQLRKERLRRGLSLAALGDKMGVSADMVRGLENSTRSTPTLSTLMGWLAALRLKLKVVDNFDETVENFWENPR